MLLYTSDKTKMNSEALNKIKSSVVLLNQNKAAVLELAKAYHQTGNDVPVYSQTTHASNRIQFRPIVIRSH